MTTTPLTAVIDTAAADSHTEARRPYVSPRLVQLGMDLETNGKSPSPKESGISGPS